jgi:hypothetical protein
MQLAAGASYPALALRRGGNGSNCSITHNPNPGKQFSKIILLSNSQKPILISIVPSTERKQPQF